MLSSTSTTGPTSTSSDGLFAHFARERGLQRLADLDRAARQAPLALQRLVRPLHQQHAIAVENHGAHGDDRPVGIGPQILRSRSNPTSDSHHLDDDAFLPPAVELGVEDLLPRTEIELAPR